jgi:hypothetical protein
MNAEVITRNLKEGLEQFSNSNDKDNVYGYSFLLRLMHETIIAYIKFSNQEFDENAELQISQMDETQLLRIKFLYEEFFPIAHTVASINHLKIVNRIDLVDEISNQGNELRHLIYCLKDAIHLLESVDSRNTLLADIVNQ